MARRFYWLKLGDDFFDSKEVKKLRKVAGGDTYTIIYLKMLLKSMSDGGRFYFEGIEETFADEIALEIDENPDDVKMTVGFLLRTGLMQEVSESEVNMTRLPEMVGSESDSARRMRKSREAKKLLALDSKASQCDNDVRERCTEKRREEKEIEIEREGEESREETEEPAAPAAAAAPPVPYIEIKDLYNGICVSFSRVVSLSTNRKKAIAARWKEYNRDLEIFRELFARAEGSAFLKGVNDRNWSADFDWLMKSDNMAKVLEGKYDGQRRPQRSGSGGMSTLDVLQNIAAAEEARL